MRNTLRNVYSLPKMLKACFVYCRENGNSEIVCSETERRYKPKLYTL